MFFGGYFLNAFTMGYESMSDQLDRASDLEEMGRKLAIDGRVRYFGISATRCALCGDLIPQDRRVAVPGCTRCVECAE